MTIHPGVIRYLGKSDGTTFEHEKGMFTDSWFSTSQCFGAITRQDVYTIDDIPSFIPIESLKNAEIILPILEQNEKLIRAQVSSHPTAKNVDGIQKIRIKWHDIKEDTLNSYWKSFEKDGSSKFQVDVADKIDAAIDQRKNANLSQHHTLLDPEPIDQILRSPAALKQAGNLMEYLQDRFAGQSRIGMYVAPPRDQFQIDMGNSLILEAKGVGEGMFKPNSDLVVQAYTYGGYYVNNKTSYRHYRELFENKKAWSPWHNLPWRFDWARRVSDTFGCRRVILASGVVFNDSSYGGPGEYRYVGDDYLRMVIDSADKYGFEKIAVWGFGTEPGEEWAGHVLRAADFIESQIGTN